jgi:HEAT repeat protein
MAAAALKHLGDSTALPSLVRLLNDEAWQVRMPAVEFVAQHAEAGAAYELIAPRLRDRHVAVRRAASEALDALVSKLR